MKYTKEHLEKIVRESKSYADVMRKAGIKCAGGNHKFIKAKIAAFDIDTSHFLGRRTNSGDNHTGGPRKKSADEILIEYPAGSLSCKAFQLRRALLEIGREYCCSECGLGGFWNDKELLLQVDHMNGNRDDNRESNLRFLCPNCHSQTKNWGYNNTGGTGLTSRALYYRNCRSKAKTPKW